MGRRRNGDDDATVLHSVALLRERFRQLQRTKEMREERDLLRVFAAAARSPDLRPCSPLQQLQPQHADDRGIVQRLQDCETSLSIGLRPHRASYSMYSPKIIAKEMEVDTSLHL